MEWGHGPVWYYSDVHFSTRCEKNQKTRKICVLNGLYHQVSLSFSFLTSMHVDCSEKDLFLHLQSCIFWKNAVFWLGKCVGRATYFENTIMAVSAMSELWNNYRAGPRRSRKSRKWAMLTLARIITIWRFKSNQITREPMP